MMPILRKLPGKAVIQVTLKAADFYGCAATKCIKLSHNADRSLSALL